MKKILLLGSYGRGNIGDDAFLAVALKLFPDATLFLNSANDALLPRSAKGVVQTISTTSNSDIRKKMRVFREAEHIIYCGGDLWVELYGDRFPRQALYKMVVVNLAARLAGKKVHYMGCGIGALQGYSLFLARLSARLANGVAVREPRSAKVLGLRKIQIMPDLVTTLDVARVGARPAAKQRTFTIGVSILYHLPSPEKNFPKLIHTLAAVLQAQPAGSYRVVLFPMLASPDEKHDDVWACKQLQELLPDADVSIFAGREIDEYVTALGNIDVMIGARLHANIIALLAGVPTIGISYRPKVAQFFAMAGLEQYCIDLNGLAAQNLDEVLRDIHDEYDRTLDRFAAAREHITQEGAAYQAFVDQYV